MLDLEVIDDPAVALTILDPVRAKVLAALAEPGSATSVADVIGETRQKVNYHLRTLEEHGLVHLVEERPRRGLTERVMVASARSYVLSPAVLSGSAADPRRQDRMSAQYLVAVAARMVCEVGELARRARNAQRSLATLTIDTEIRFGSAAERAAFARELAETVTLMASRYHDEETPGGRWHRLIVAAHPRLTTARATTDRATTDRATTDRATTARATTARATTDRATTDRATTDRATPHKVLNPTKKPKRKA